MSETVSTIKFVMTDSYWLAQPEFRWLRPGGPVPDRLQQAWRSDRGVYEWRDVPVVIDPE